jgi:hypothetical protein
MNKLVATIVLGASLCASLAFAGKWQTVNSAYWERAQARGEIVRKVDNAMGRALGIQPVNHQVYRPNFFEKLIGAHKAYQR